MAQPWDRVRRRDASAGSNGRVQVTVGQRAGQCLRLATRCLWDTAADNGCSASFENETMFCVAMVFGLYFE